MKTFSVTKEEILKQPLEKRLQRYSSYIDELIRGKLIQLNNQSLLGFSKEYFNNGIPDDSGLLPIEKKVIGSKAMPIDGLYFLLKKWGSRNVTTKPPKKGTVAQERQKPILHEDLF